MIKKIKDYMMAFKYFKNSNEAVTKMLELLDIFPGKVVDTIVLNDTIVEKEKNRIIIDDPNSDVNYAILGMINKTDMIVLIDDYGKYVIDGKSIKELKYEHKKTVITLVEGGFNIGSKRKKCCCQRTA